MSFEELNGSLHGRDAHLERVRKPTAFEPGGAAPDEGTLAQFSKTEQWSQPKTTPSTKLVGVTFEDISGRQRRKKIALILGGIALVLVLGGLAYKMRTLLFNVDRVQLSVSGPSEVASAESTSFTFIYANNNLIALNNATLILTYPEVFHPEAQPAMKISASQAEITLGAIKGRSQGKVVLVGKFYGSKGDHVLIRATLRYAPNNVTSLLETETTLTVNVASSPLSLEIEAPLELASGQNVEYTLQYNNTGDLGFSNLKVQADYPAGFEFVESEPRPASGNNLWHVGDLITRGSGKIIVRGTLSGERDERKSITARIGFFQGDGNFVSYSDNERKTVIVASPLTITQKVNNQTDAAIDLGGSLKYDVTYKNEGNIGVRGAIVTVEIDSPYLDFGRLNLSAKGAYDEKSHLITWKASDVPSLAKLEPGQGGTISFSVPVLSVISESLQNERNLTIRSVARIDSLDIPLALDSNKIIASNVTTVKVNTAVEAKLSGFYQDTTLSNAGPLPPKVGQETSYTFHMALHNTSNDVTDARVIISLPSGMRFTGKFSPVEERMLFDSRTNELTWNVDTLAARANRELLFQIAVTPDPSQVGADVPLVNSFTFSGKDSFTGKDITVSSKARKTSNLPEDPVAAAAGGAVQPAN